MQDKIFGSMVIEEATAVALKITAFKSQRSKVLLPESFGASFLSS